METLHGKAATTIAPPRTIKWNVLDGLLAHFSHSRLFLNRQHIPRTLSSLFLVNAVHNRTAPLHLFYAFHARFLSPTIFRRYKTFSLITSLTDHSPPPLSSTITRRHLDHGQQQPRWQRQSWTGEQLPHTHGHQAVDYSFFAHRSQTRSS